MPNDKRARVWTFEGYPSDSLPENYVSILNEEYHLCWAESPVHDADVNPDGTIKKAHIHFIVVFDGMKSYEQIKEITDRLNSPIPQVCRNPRSLVRYFIHLDNPEKHQYKQSDIKCHGGFSCDDYFKQSNSDIRKTLREIIQFIVDNDIREFGQLCEIIYAMDNDEWFDVLTNRNTLFLSQYLKSRHFMTKE